MKAHDPAVKDKVLEFLKKSRSLNEISTRTGICVGTIEDWASIWRKDGTLTAYKREGAAYTQKAKLLSNGFYSAIRKCYHSIKGLDKLEGRQFGFNNPIEAIPYFLKDGVPRVCAYCGAKPSEDKVWNLDRIDSSLGHVPYNLVPCCGANAHGNQMSCQASKSRYDLRGWLGICIARAFGRPATVDEIEDRARDIENLAKEITIFGSISLDIHQEVLI